MFDEIDAREGALFAGRPSQEPPYLSKLMSLAVAVLLGMLAALFLLPAFSPHGHVHYRSMQCASDLRQMGLGIAQYANVFNRYPPGTVPNPDLPLERRLGWGSTILSYLDMTEYLRDHGLTEDDLSSRAWDDPAFSDLAKSPPGITHCPESWPRRANFVAIAGLGVDAPSLPTKHRRAGIFGDDRRVTPADVTDGLATTMMLTETNAGPGPWFAGGRSTVRGLDPFHKPYLGPGRQFGGLHKGGANVLFADGSVMFISDSIDPKVFEAMSTMAGGEKVSVPWDN